jgi:hypothetical protein
MLNEGVAELIDEVPMKGIENSTWAEILFVPRRCTLQ